MARQSVHQKLARVRKPRVHITYDVEVGNAIEQKELPFVVGVLADLSGDAKEPLPRMRDRKFVEVDKENFNKVLAGAKPRLVFNVPSRLTEDDKMIPVELTFRHMDDFGPEAVAQQVPQIRQLVEARQRLSELAIKLGSNDKLEELLQGVIRNTDALKELSGSPSAADAPKKEDSNG